ARKRAHLTQQELCQKAGLSYSTLAKIERGAIRSPSVFTVANIATATGTSIEELLELGSRNTDSPAPVDSKKRSKNGVRFVYFDVNGTLVRFYERAFTQISEESHTPLEIVESIFLHYDGAACRGSMQKEEVEKIIGGEIGLPDFSWEKYYMNNVEPTPGTAELLSWVTTHYEIGLLTNNWPDYTAKLMDKGVVPKINYTAIVESARAGCSKPEAKIYEIAQQLTGMQPQEILLVDDQPAYLAGAQKAGWHTELFDESNLAESIERIKQALAF
ncbi:HAD-IA family hydrolase, partial [Candidatus Saccharibacteria bacterium]|nr:HAD-IA family hydrolase [Candidatus Saccharibacteria bacterium]